MTEQADILTVLEFFGARFDTANYFFEDEVPVWCPFCEDYSSRKPAGRVNHLKNVYYCFVCGTGGSPRSLLDKFMTIELVESE